MKQHTIIRIFAILLAFFANSAVADSLWSEFRDRFSNPIAQIEEINRGINKMQYATDQAIWKQEEYWATPEEFFAAGAGDCEDYAIAKFALLEEYGAQLAYVFYKKTPHMVVIVNGLVLDNITNRIEIVENRSDLVFVVRFDRVSVEVKGQTLPTQAAFFERLVKENK